MGIAAGLAAGALWGLVFVAPRMVPGLSAVDFVAGRFLAYGAFSLALMALMAWSRRTVWPTRRQALAALGLSVLGFTGYYLLLVLAIRDAGTSVPTLIIGTIPLWMMLLGKPAGLRWRSVLPGLLLTLLGLALMMQAIHGAAASTVEGGMFWRGVVWAVLAMALWTAFGLLNAAWLQRHPDVNATTWANWLGVATGLGALGLWVCAGTDASVLWAQEDVAQAVLLCTATGVGSAWLATLFWNIASQRLSASLCGQLIVSETLFALLYSFMWDRQWPSAVQALACVLFVLGIVASVRAHR
jgi:drug/metabolite transporter (DMT)-like permease